MSNPQAPFISPEIKESFAAQGKKAAHMTNTMLHHSNAFDSDQFSINQSWINSRELVATWQEQANEFGQTLHLIEVYGHGFQIMSENFQLDRNYFHSPSGKKMFFQFIETIKPA